MVWVEFTTVFAARDVEEANRVIDELFAADEDVVCPGTDGPWEPCAHCGGTLQNPPDSGTGSDGHSDEDPDAAPDEDPDEAQDAWAPGEPCVLCSMGPRPGWTQPCVREHTASAVIRPSEQYLSSEDERMLRFLRELRGLQLSAPEQAQLLVAERLAVLESLAEQFRQASAT